MRYRGPCIGSCHRHDLFFLSRLHIGEEIIGIVIAEADNRIGDANRSVGACPDSISAGASPGMNSSRAAQIRSLVECLVISSLSDARGSGLHDG